MVWGVESDYYGITPEQVIDDSNKGYMLMKLERYDEALDAYNKALEIDPNYEHAIKGRQAALGNLSNGSS